MLTVSVDAIKDYQVCELFYNYRYLETLGEPLYSRELLAQRFENTLKRVVSFFFYKKQGSATPSYNALLNRWEKLWFPKEMDAYALSVDQQETIHGNLAHYSNVAVAALMAFHAEFSKDPSEVLLIDEKYLMPLSDDIRLEGTIDLLLRHKNQYRLIKWSARQKRPTMTSLTADFASLRLAFEYRNEVRKSVSYGLYDLASTKPGFLAAEPTKSDMNALVFWAGQITNTETFVPRRGFTVYCRGCPFDGPCSRWKDWPEYGRH